MRIGLTASPAELPATLTAYPNLATCRVFAPPGKGIPAWTSPTMTALIRAGAIPWPSFKDWNSDGQATTSTNVWLTAMPPDLPEVWLTYHHEPEADLNPRDYRRRWALLARTVRAHHNGDRVKLIPIHTLYPTRHKIWDRYSTDWTQWVGIWQQWAPTAIDGRYVGDYMGWDCYLETTAATYEDPRRFFATPIGAAHATGVPLVIPELGAIRTATDTTGAGRAAWITECLTHLRQHDTQAVCWWQSTGTNGKDYRLSDDPARRAWQDAISGT
jgi:hypothetical protein